MTLEDFFTLTETKNGLATVGRVEELISVMQHEKDYVMCNVSDSGRKWLSVASTLAATENKGCLNHFVELGGLCYLNQWLEESLKFGDDIADHTIEELLLSLVRLPISREDSVASGIQLTVDQLVGFKSINIKEKARALSERWRNAAENGVTDQDMNKGEKCEDNNLKPPGDVGTVDDVNLPHPVVDIPTCRELEEGNCRAESAGIGCPSQTDNTDDVLTSTKEIVHANSSISDVANANIEDVDALPSPHIPFFAEMADVSSLDHLVETTSSVTFCSNADDHCDASVLKDENVKEMKMEVDTKEGSPSKLGQTESSKVTSSGSSVSSQAHKHERSLSCNFDAKEIKSYTLDTIETLPRSASTDCVVPKCLRNLDCRPDMQDLLCIRSKLRINDDLEREFESGSEDKGETIAPHDNFKPAVKKSIVEMDRMSELGLEYGDFDALEVARQVAIEVEREVVDYREPFCSSPDGNSLSSYNEEQEARDLDDASSFKDDNLRNSGTNMGPSECGQVMEMPKPMTCGSGDKTERNRCVFDLNEDACAGEESDCSINCMPNNSVNVTIPVAVAASKEAPFLPICRPHFGGELGWKGSAATSAFRIPSPRRTPDINEKTSSSHKRKADMIDFDLNVSETGDHDAQDSAAVGSRRVDKLKFDLNRLGDEDVLPFPHQNGDGTMCSTSSSSSKQRTPRDFDLNDSPNFLDAMVSHGVNKSSSVASDNPIITITGSKITERRGCLSEAPQPLTWSSRLHQIPLPSYGYIGPMMGPSIPFPPPFYPCTLDSRGRGAAFVPQILNTMGLNNASSSSSIPPFLMSVPSAFRPALDLNSGFMSAEETERSGNFAENFFTQGCNGFKEGHAYR